MNRSVASCPTHAKCLFSHLAFCNMVGCLLVFACLSVVRAETYTYDGTDWSPSTPGADWSPSTPGDLTGDNTFNVTTGSPSYNGSTDSTTTLTKEGEGTLTLGGNNMFPGGITLNEGTLNITGTLATGSTLSAEQGTTIQTSNDSFQYGNNTVGTINLNQATLEVVVGHTTCGAILNMNDAVVTGDTSDGSVEFIFDSKIDVLGGENNVINAGRIAFRNYNNTGREPGVINIADGAKLTIASTIKTMDGFDNIVINGGTLRLTGKLESRPTFTANNAIVETSGDCFLYGNNSVQTINLNGATLKVFEGHTTCGAVLNMSDNAVVTGNTSDDNAEFIFDSAINVLSGVNNVIDAGRIVFRNYQNTGTNSGVINVAEGATLTIASTIKDYGWNEDVPIVKEGAGTLVLTGISTKTDELIVNGGTLSLASTNTLATGTTLTANSGTVVETHGDNFQWGNDSVGTINLNGATLRVLDSHTTCGAILNMSDNAVVTGNTSDNRAEYIFDSAINVLSGENNRIDAGRIAFRNYKNTGTDSGVIDVAEDAKLTITSTLANFDNDDVAIIKRGLGTLAFSGTNNFDRGITVEEGRFEFSGTATAKSGKLTVEENGILSVSNAETSNVALEILGTLELNFMEDFDPFLFQSASFSNDAKLHLIFPEGFAPTGDESITILNTTDGITMEGALDWSTNLPDADGWLPIFSGNSLIFAPNQSGDPSLPEPATWVLLVVGFVGIVAKKRCVHSSKK